MVVAAEEAHFDSVARMHIAGLPGGFLSSLGPAALRRLYAGIARQEDSVVLVGLVDDQVVGFVSGTVDVRRCYRGVLTQNAIGISFAAISRVLRPSSLRRVVETLTYPLRFRRGAAATDAPDPGCTAELLSIAVDARARGRRVGAALVGELEQFLCSRGVRGRYRVVTDAEDPQSNAFYERTGFERIGGFLNHGHPMVMYVKPLPESSP